MHRRTAPPTGMSRLPTRTDGAHEMSETSERSDHVDVVFKDLGAIGVAIATSAAVMPEISNADKLAYLHCWVLDEANGGDLH